MSFSGNRLKPANILVLRDGQVKVADFGVAKFDTSELTQTGFMIGTPSYMSPEQMQGQPADARSELYSLGLVLFELLTGSRAMTDPDMNLDSRLIQVPAAFPGVLRKALDKEPNRRFQSGPEMREALLHAHRQHLVGAQADVGAGTMVIENRPNTHRAEKSAYVWEPDLLAMVERTLATHVGPLAARLVQESAPRMGNARQLADALAHYVDAEQERDALRAEVLRVTEDIEPAVAINSARLPSAAVAGVIPGFDAVILGLLTSHLTTFVGPLAETLVRRAALSATGLDELCRQLAEHIPSAEERQRFLETRTSIPGL